MDLWSLFSLLARRWYFSVPLLIASLTGALLASENVPPEYRSSAAVMVVVPAETPSSEVEGSAPVGSNPYQNVGGEAVAEMLSLSAESSATQRGLESRGLSTDYSVAPAIEEPATTGSGIIAIEAMSSDRGIAVQTARRLVDVVARDLEVRQNRISAGLANRMWTTTIDAADGVEPVLERKVQVYAAFIAGALILALALTVALDGLLRRRRDSRGRLAETEPGEHGPVAESGQLSETGAERVLVHSNGSESDPEHGDGAGGTPPRMSRARRFRRRRRVQAEKSDDEAGRAQLDTDEHDTDAHDTVVQDSGVHDAEPGPAEHSNAERDPGERDPGEPDPRSSALR